MADKHSSLNFKTKSVLYLATHLAQNYFSLTTGNVSVQFVV